MHTPDISNEKIFFRVASWSLGIHYRERAREREKGRSVFNCLGKKKILTEKKNLFFVFLSEIINI